MKSKINRILGLVLVLGLALPATGLATDGQINRLQSKSPTQTQTPVPDPDQAPGQAPTQTEFSGEGGQVRANGETSFEFTPAVSGRWVFTTSDNGHSDPYLTLYNESGESIGFNDDSAGNLNARLGMTLQEGVTYTVTTGFYGGSGNTCTVTAEMLPETPLPSGGGEVRVDSPTYFSIRPDTAGRWQFITSANGDSDPQLTLSDAAGNEIASDDDSAGNLNARIDAVLEAGVTYYIMAGFYNDDEAYSYALSSQLLVDTPLPADGGQVHVSGPTYYSFSPKQSGRWTFSTSDNGDCDPQLTLFDATGTSLAFDDDNGGNLNARIDAVLEEGASYSIYAGFYSEGSGGGYNLNAEMQVDVPLSAGQTHVADTTYYSFTPEQSGRWVFSTSDNGDCDPQLTLFDAQGNNIAYDDDSAGNMNARVSAVLEAGVPYSVLAAFYSHGSGSGYNLNVEQQIDTPLPAGGGQVQVNATTYYSFSPAESGRWTFTTSDNRGDPTLTLFDAQGNTIQYDDDSAGNSNARISAVLEAGTRYSLLADFWNSTSGGKYTLSAEVRQDIVLPADGGEVQISGVTYLSFTPATSGRWIFTTSDNVNCDPTLSLLDAQGNHIAYDDDSAGNLNARMGVMLEAGASYTVLADAYDSSSDISYTLSVTQQDDIPLPANGGQVQVTTGSYFSFTPDTSGRWEFRTSDNGQSDPVLTLFDKYGNYINSDDDGAGSLNARLSQVLEAGVLYSLQVGFYNGGQDNSCTLTVEQIRDLPIPGTGGQVRAEAPTYFSFKPASSGRWVIYTSDNGSGDPQLTLYDPYGYTLQHDDDSAGNLNARIVASLEAGSEYLIYAGLYRDDPSGFTLHVEPKGDETLPGGGGRVQVSEETQFNFTPDRSGPWEFRTFGDAYGDPQLTLSDQYGNTIAYDDDGGNGLNAYLAVELQAGVPYSLLLEFWSGSGSCTLSVTHSSQGASLPSLIKRQK